VTLRSVKLLIRKIRKSNLPIVINSWGLCFLYKKLELLSDEILTTESVVILDKSEFVHLWDTLCDWDILSYGASVSEAVSIPIDRSCPIGVEFPSIEHPHAQAIQQSVEVAEALGPRVVVVRTGFYDVIAHDYRCFMFGGPLLKKRCSNQGDLLAGLITLFLSWQKLKNVTNNPMNAASIADAVLRLAVLDCSTLGTRVVIASDVAKCVPLVFHNIETILKRDAVLSTLKGEDSSPCTFEDASSST